jgi:hypothetical protein
MGLRPTTMHENSLFDTKFFISNSDSGYFHGSEVRFQDSGGVHRTPETGNLLWLRPCS